MFYPDPIETEDYEHVLASIQRVLDQFDVPPVSLSELMQYIKDDQYSREYYNLAFQETMDMASLNAPRHDNFDTHNNARSGRMDQRQRLVAALPNEPVDVIQEKLKECGFDVSIRTIRRDLKKT